MSVEIQANIEHLKNLLKDKRKKRSQKCQEAGELSGQAAKLKNMTNLLAFGCITRKFYLKFIWKGPESFPLTSEKLAASLNDFLPYSDRIKSELLKVPEIEDIDEVIDKINQTYSASVFLFNYLCTLNVDIENQEVLGKIALAIPEMSKVRVNLLIALTESLKLDL